MGTVLLAKESRNNELTAYITMGESGLYEVTKSINRFSEFKNKYCTSFIGIANNKWGTYLTLTPDQIDEFSYFISDFVLLVCPSIVDENIIVGVEYYSYPPSSQPTMNLNLYFYPDGRVPSDSEIDLIDKLRLQTE